MSWINHAERYVDIFKKSIMKYLKSSNAPLVLWCYCVYLQSKSINATVRDNFHLYVQTPDTLITGQTTDISAICELGWYNWCYYRDTSSKFPSPVERLSIVIGTENHVGVAMSRWVMNDHCNVLPCQTLCYLNIVDINSDIEEQKLKYFDVKIQLKLCYYLYPPKDPIE